MSKTTRITVVCAILLVATLFSFEAGQVGIGRQVAASVAIVIAFIKMRFVAFEFMELGDAPLPLRLVVEAWMVIVCAALLGVYWLA